MKNFWKNKKVLVTGGSGFIGSSMINSLVKNHSIVTAAVSTRTTKHKIMQIRSKSNNSIKIKSVDLISYKNCLNITKGQDIILHFAAMDGSASYKSKNSSEIFRTNTQMALNILESARINNIDRVLLMSSIEIYSPSTKSPVKEKDGFKEGLSLDNGYAWSKRLLEISAATYSKQYGMKIAIARPGNVYGPLDKFDKKKARVIPLFIKLATKGDTITIAGNSTKKSFLYIDDLTDALLTLVEKYAVCDPVNIASSKYIYLKDLGKLIIKLTKSKSKIQVNKSIVKSKKISIKKAVRFLDFKEKTNLQEGIANLL